jgi:hypothetical protein
MIASALALLRGEAAAANSQQHGCVLGRWAWLLLLAWSLGIVFHGCHSHDEDLLVFVRQLGP